MKVLSIILASTLASVTLTGVAQAMGNQGDHEYNTFIVKMTDSNGDGKMSKEEFMKMSAKMAEKEFAMLDMNDDNFVEAEEFITGNR